MYSNLFSEKSVQDLISILPSLPTALWETFYVTVLSTALSLVIGLPLGVLLVTGEKDGVLPLPGWLMHLLNIIINLLRSIPFLILMIMVLPLSRALIGTAVGTTATIVPLVAAAFPFVARLVESSLRELDGNIIEAAQSMGASPFQIICKVMIPESVPSLIQNVTIALTTVLSYSAASAKSPSTTATIATSTSSWSLQSSSSSCSSSSSRASEHIWQRRATSGSNKNPLSKNSLLL